MLKSLFELYFKLRESYSGQTMTEYVLILAAVAVGALVAYQNFGTYISTIAI